MARIGFIGLGKMGRGMASNLVARGHSVTVNDLDAAAGSALVEAGAQWAKTPGDAAEAADVLFTSLPTPAIVRAVADGPDGVSARLRRGSTWFDLSTNSLDVVRSLHSELLDRDVAFLDSPVSGGPAGAAEGTLAIWVGGDEKAFDEHRPILEDFGSSVRRLGGIGTGTTAKVIHNSLTLTVHAAVAEGMSIGVKAGIEPADLFETLRSGAIGRRRTLDALIPRFLAGELDRASFQLQLAHKDIGLARRLAQDLEVPARLFDLAYDEVSEAMNRGWGERDSQSFMLLQQERAGVAPYSATADRIEEIRRRT